MTTLYLRMARVKNNVIMRGLSGNFNKQIVFKQYGKVTVASSYPDMSKVIPSEKQKDEKFKFRMAMAFAKRELADPKLKAEYKSKVKGMQRPHNVAVSDFYNPPIIGEIQILKSLIKITAWDDFKVVSVSAELYNSAGILLEKGSAEEKSFRGWEYIVIGTYDSLTGGKLVVKAKDKPGNVTVKEIIFP